MPTTPPAPKPAKRNVAGVDWLSRRLPDKQHLPRLARAKLDHFTGESHLDGGGDSRSRAHPQYFRADLDPDSMAPVMHLELETRNLLREERIHPQGVVVGGDPSIAALEQIDMPAIAPRCIPSAVVPP